MNIEFRDEQKEILKYTKGIMSISAVPGSGKTFILTHLAVKLLKEEIKEEKLLLLTYMNSAVETFEIRLKELLGTDLLNKVQISTIHKLSADILKENINYTKLAENYTLVDIYDKDRIIDKVLRPIFNSEKNKFKYLFKEKEFNERNSKDFYTVLKKSISFNISKVKMEGINYHKIFTETDKYDNSFLPILARIYKEYQEELNKKSAIDYDDLLFYAYDLLKNNKEICEIYIKRYKYIFEDEAQDSNRLQNKILSLLSGKLGNLVKVGDSNQSIMGTFTSSSPEIFRKFVKRAPIKKEVSMSARNTLAIQRLANLFHKYTKDKHPCIEARDALVKPYIYPVKEGIYKNPVAESRSIKQITLQDEFEETKYLIYFIKKFKEKYPEKSIGILLPRNSLISTISAKLKKENIDFDTITDIDVEVMEVLKKLGDIISFLAEPSSNKEFINIVKNYFLPKGEYINREIVKVLQNIWLEELFFDNYSFGGEVTSSSQFIYIKKAINKLSMLLEFSTNSPERILIYIGEHFDFTLEEQSLIDNIALNLKKVFKLNPKWTLRDLASELRKGQNNKFSRFNPIIKDKKFKEKNLVITNYHKSKGREWDMVYLFGLNTFYFPIFLSQVAYGDKRYLHEKYLNPEAYMSWEIDKYLGKEVDFDPILKYKADRIAECIRVIFVGITRAREHLLLSHNREKDDFYSLLFNKLIERIYNG